MKQIALVSLETKTGIIRRYLRVEGNKPEKTGQDRFKRWVVARTHEDQVFDLIQAFRKAYTPADAPPPKPTGPRRQQMRAAA